MSTTAKARVSKALAAACGLTLVAIPLLSATPAASNPVTDFDPGFIISDAVMHNHASMSVADIDAFIRREGASCTSRDGLTCLKDYRETTVNRTSPFCPGAYVGAANESAAQIIAKASVACRINPQVLLVKLQKEQGLITNARPPETYARALGFGCPDTIAPACMPQFGGFANQVWSAVARLQEYAARPEAFNHRAGRVNNILFHPNAAACGSSPVFIQNQATASLYNYTPYQPNPAALAAGRGLGDQCSAYGNRNFHIFFNMWFGNPRTGAPAPGGGGGGTTTPASPNAAVVRALYADLLGRGVDPTGLNTWTSHLASGRSQSDLVRTLTRSEEYVRIRVRQAYREVLRREPEAAGWNDWTARVLRGELGVDDVQWTFFLSQEFYNQGGGTDAGYVRHLYRTMLGREANQGEVDMWANQIRVAGRNSVTRGVWFSLEAAIRRTDGYYRLFLGRASDWAGVNNWAQLELRSGQGAVREGLAGSVEYRNRAISRFP